MAFGPPSAIGTGKPFQTTPAPNPGAQAVHKKRKAYNAKPPALQGLKQAATPTTPDCPSM